MLRLLLKHKKQLSWYVLEASNRNSACLTSILVPYYQISKSFVYLDIYIDMTLPSLTRSNMISLLEIVKQTHSNWESYRKRGKVFKGLELLSFLTSTTPAPNTHNLIFCTLKQPISFCDWLQGKAAAIL